MKKTLFRTIMCVGIASMLLGGCTNDDVYNPEAVVKRYENAWEKQFGKVDPNQTWNTAARVTAVANVPYISGEAIMSIYTSNPLESDSRLLAKTAVNSGTGTISFDIPSTTTQVFVAIESNDLYRVYGYYAVENGTVSITPSSSVAQTRAASNVTKGSIQKTSNVKYNTTTQVGWKIGEWGQGKTYEEWEADYRKLGTSIQYNNPGPYTTESIATYTRDNYNNVISVTFDFSNPQLKEGVQPYYGAEQYVELTPLNGVEKTTANPWNKSWGYTMFGPGSFFEEQKKYYESPKLGLYDSATLAQLEKGFSITTSGGEIKIPFIYGATNNTNKFGYVYYKDGQDPLTQPHYILMNDARPSENIYHGSWRGTAVQGMELSRWTDEDKTNEALIYGTEYKLYFFGDDHNETATYTFPTGYHIVFFIYQNDGDWKNNFNYSIPELNKRIGHNNYNGTTAEGAVKCAAWTFKGHTFVGFEDGGNDEDLNDIVFWAEGAYAPDDTPIVVPDPTPTPKPVGNPWILACEDLGSTDDFDFNDIVFSVSHVSGETTATVTPLAAGGTLPAYICFGSLELGEIHTLLGGSSTTEFINTTGSKGTAGEPVTINVDKDFSMTGNNMGGFSVKVITKDNSEATVRITAPGQGTAPQMICVPGEWAWPTERTNISDAYPAFGEWGANYATNKDWYKKPNGGVVK